jgi:hypothetical protein
VIRASILLLFAPLAIQAQLELVVGQTNVTGATYSLGPVAAGTNADVVILAEDTGSAPITITQLTLSGTGFQIVNTSTIPYPVAPGNFMRIELQFSAGGGSLGKYSATLQVNTVSVILTATSVATATLSVAAPCTGPDTNLNLSFGNIPVSQSVTCSFQLLNQSSQALAVSTIAVTGGGFLFSQAPSTPLNLPPGLSSTFTIKFAPNAATSYSGILTVDSQAFALTGTAFNPPLPTPSLTFDTNTPQSGQQITLTMTLPSPSPIAASGSINLAFQPGSAAAGGDPTVRFVANGARSMPFSIQPGATEATLSGQPGAVFATGTTAGKITFSVSTGAQLSGDPTTSLTLSPIPISVDNVAATSIAGALRIQVWGFDNTDSAGPMSFTFLDGLGNPIGAGPVTADFTSAFHNYFASSTDGGAFQMLVTFPVTGNSAEVGSVDLQMTSAAGTTTISQLVFLNDTGTCVLVGNVLSCPPAPTQ